MINKNEREIIRELAKKVAAIASTDEMAQLRKEWARHNDLEQGRPMLLFFPEGSWGEILPDSVLKCDSVEARAIEWQLRSTIFAHEHFDTDNVVSPYWDMQKTIHNTGFGLEGKTHASSEARGAWGFEPIISTPDDLKKIKTPVISVDEEDSKQRLEMMNELIGDIYPVRMRGVNHISFHLMGIYTRWRGLTETFMDMYEEPEMLHEAMSIMEKAHHSMIQQYIDLNLLATNNDHTYHNSGGYSFTNQLPRPDFNPDKVRPCDMWASAEAQEMALVSPEQHDEFILQYEKRLMAPFAVNGYGCCEDLTKKLDIVFTIPNIRRVSVSPWADPKVCAEKMQGNYILSWKTHPAHLVGHFDEKMIAEYLKSAIVASRENGSRLEIILKDTHTCENHPERFDQYAKIARRVMAENWE
ncbi:MAG: hypothetical protein WCO98_05120 [bacterium]